MQLDTALVYLLNNSGMTPAKLKAAEPQNTQERTKDFMR
jgi:hypothetical protein